MNSQDSGQSSGEIDELAPLAGDAPDAGEDALLLSDSTGMRRRQVRGSALLLIGRMLTLLLTTVTQIVIVRALTKTDFGGFAYALALANAGFTLLSLGQGKLLSRFMAKYQEQRDYDRMFGSMVLAVLTIAATSTLALGALFLLRNVLIASAVRDPATVKVVLILVFLGPLDALDQVFISLFAVFSRPGAIFVRKYLFTPVLRLAIVLALAITGASVTFMAVGYVATGVAGLGVSCLVFVQVLRERGLLQHLRPRHIILPVRAVMSFSLPMITGELFLLSVNVGGVLVLAYYSSSAEVAGYRAVFTAARLNNAVMLTFVPLFLPLATRLFARADLRGLREAYWHTGAIVSVLTFPIFALTGPLAPRVTVALFGIRYADSKLILSLLSLGYYFSVVLGFNAYMLQVCQRIRYLVVVNVFVAVLNVGLCIVLVHRYSAIGVALANLVALVAQNLLNQLALRRAIDTAFIDRSCLRCYLVVAACAGALWAFQALVHPTLPLGVLAAAAASIVVLLSSRSALELGETFPELRRVPLVQRFVG